MEGVRRAEAADIGRCCELLGEAVASLGHQRGATLLLRSSPGSADPERLIGQWLDAEGCRLVVGTFDGTVVGIGVGSLVDGPGGRLGRIECCYVEPGARTVGVGQSMIEDLVTWFSEQGCDGVDAVALPGDRSSKQLLEAAGFKARLLVLHRSLG